MSDPQNGPAQGENQSPENNLRAAYQYFARFLSDVIDLRKGVESRTVIDEIKGNQSMSGANAWMLMCSIMIASIGLSMNSQAVIIGGMLISPLMSPMLGIGLSVGINDMDTLKRSLAHFGIAIFIAIATSTIYFYLSPVDTVTDEIRMRTQPTFLDIFVAVFGGTAGIVSIARKDISTTLPGVAIATALMPPLCVTGFGIAKGNLAQIALPSFYLFFLNSFFVILATYLIIRYLKFPYKKYLEKRIWRKNVVYILIFSLAVVIPSYFIFRGVIRDLNSQVSLDKFENFCLGDKRIFLDSYHYEKEEKVLFLKVYGNVIGEEDVPGYLDCLADVGMADINIEVIPTSDVNLSRVQMIEAGIQEINEQLEAAESGRVETTKVLNDYREQIIDTSRFSSLKEEIQILFPGLANIGLAKAHFSDFEKDQISVPTIFVQWQQISRQEKEESRQKLSSFVERRMDLDTLYYIEY